MLISSRNCWLLAVSLQVACGATPPKASAPAGAAGEAARESQAPAVVAKMTEPEPYVAGASPSDVVAPWVRLERSSRLGVPLPKGRARERWSTKLDGTADPAFLLSAGTRIVVQGRATGRQSFVLFDTNGRFIRGGAIHGDILLRPAEGIFFASGDTGALTLATGGASSERESGGDLQSARVATHDGVRVRMLPSSVQIEAATGTPRTIVERPVEAFDAAIDEAANVHVLVRQDKDLALWTTPLAGGSVGRVRIGPLRRDRAEVPPILGTAVRVVVLDDRLVAFGRDGRQLWERKGVLTGGATITADDRLLVATDGKVLAIDPSGRASEIASAPKEIFLTAPILTGKNLLVVASGTAVHAYGFE